MIALQILKIIAIVLACIVGFAIVVILLVIFAPFQYTVSAVGKDKDIEAKLNVKWLFGFFNFNLVFCKGKLDLKARILGIVIAGKNALSGKKEKAPRKAKAAEEEKTPEESEKNSSGGAFKRKIISFVLGVDRSKKKEDTPADAEDDGSGKLKKTIRKVVEKIKKIWHILKVSKYVIGAPVTKRALKYIKEKSLVLLGHLKPRSYKGTVLFGTGDPANTAEAYAAAGCIAAMLDERLVIIPEMENKVVDLDVVIRGRIFVGCMISFGLKLLTNKDIRRVVRYLGRNL